MKGRISLFFYRYSCKMCLHVKDVLLVVFIIMIMIITYHTYDSLILESN